MMQIEVIENPHFITEQDYCFFNQGCLALGLLAKSAHFIAYAEQLAKPDSIHFWEIAEHYVVLGISEWRFHLWRSMINR